MFSNYSESRVNFSSASDSTFSVKMTPFFFQCMQKGEEERSHGGSIRVCSIEKKK